ncbi:MAG: large repetitive protein [Verrucomicrobiota bacterium]|jgi:hypothetical protein
MASVVAALAMLAGARGAIFDFSAQYPAVTASFGGGVVSMSVFDEDRLMTKTLNVPSGTTFDLTTANGVVAWGSGSQVSYYVYNPTVGLWIGETGAWGPTASDLQTANGLVAWSTTAGTIYYRVYDRQRGAWKSGSAITGPASNLRIVDGTLAWSVSGPTGSAHARVYDPIKGAWESADVSGISVNAFVNTNGVVAFSSTATIPGRVYYFSYDPTRGGWQSGSQATGVPSDLHSNNGVIAWSVNPGVFFAVYDPARGLWAAGSEPASGYAADLVISNSVVLWNTANASYARAYNPLSATWSAGPAVRLAYFAVSTNGANAPLLVHFIDMSIGGLGWAWNFGDGFNSAARSPTHRYTNLAALVATETVTGSFGSSSTNKLIVTDVTGPTGTVNINAGASFTTNPAVTLALSATDNSGAIATMRFSNTGAAWSDWESYSVSRTWTLSAGDGTKTVYVQFADAATNISVNATDTIQLDTSPLPVVTVLNTNVAEGAGSAIVRVLLSTNFSRLISIHYATTNATATAGLDFTNVSGRLDFFPGTVVQSFAIPIVQDPLVEVNETISIVLSDPTNCIPGLPGTVTILSDDAPSVSFSATNFAVLEGVSNAAVGLQLSAASGQPVTIGVLATNGTATAGSDFIATNGFVTIPAGQTNGVFMVTILNDSVDELSETILLRVTAVTNAMPVSPTNAILTILDDDAPHVGFSQKLYSAFENAGFVAIEVRLSKPVTQQVEFDYLVFGGTATPGSSGDYEPQSQHRIFAAGVTNIVFFVNLVDNGVAENDETVHMSLSNITHADPGPNAEADIVIHDDDGPPLLIAPRWGTNRLFLATAQGRTGQVFTVYTSSNLTNWTPAFTLTNGTGSLDFSDSASSSLSKRFYRTSVP